MELNAVFFLIELSYATVQGSRKSLSLLGESIRGQ